MRVGGLCFLEKKEEAVQALLLKTSYGQYLRNSNQNSLVGM